MFTARAPARRGWLLSLVALFALVLAGLPGGVRPARAASELFFSEYIEGTSNNKALEIFNDTGTAVDLEAGGYNVQMYFNGNSSAGLTINLVGTVADGAVFVLAHSSAAPAILAQADQTNGAGWFNGDDAVVLRRGTSIIDVIGQIGVDPGTEWGAGLISTADNTLRRKPAVTAGDGNGNDPFDPAAEWDGFATDTFDGLGSHTLATGDAAPSVSSTTPANGAADVAVATNLTITFSEAVNVIGNWFSITCTTSGTHIAAVSGGPQSFTLDPDADFASDESCTATIVASQVRDQDADDPPDTMAANFSWSFNTLAPPTSIHAIQGAGHLSPRNGQMVSNVQGIVTAVRSNGFYLQDPAPDNDEATSEGLFVFTSSPPAVSLGDAVRVSGRVAEFRPGGSSSTNLTTTELTAPVVTILSSDNPLPTPTIIGRGGRVPPQEVIEDDAAGSVETSGVFDPAQDGIDFYESLEGMLVQVNDAIAVGPTNDFGEIPVLADAGADAGVRTARGGILIRPADFNPERIILDDTLAAMPAVDVGDRFATPIVGVLDYSFGNFKLLAAAPLAVVAGGLAREAAAPAGPRALAVATFNVENLDPTDPPAKFDDLARLIVTNLQAPDLIALEEVQDNNGPTNDTVVDATETYTRLIAAIQAAGGPAYQFRQIDPVDDQDGGEPGGNIRVGFLFRTDRGLAFIDRPGADSTTGTAVVPGTGGPQLTFSPGRIDPTNPAFTDSRKPLAGEFSFNGETLFVIANHFNSKGGDDPLLGRFQPPNRITEAQRTRQAQVVNDFVDRILALDPRANIIVLGDLNDFEFSDALNALKGGVLHNLIETLPQAERYTYVFDGNSQALDHLLVSANLFEQAQPAYDIVHVNAEFATQASDHDPQVARFTCIDFTPPVLNVSATPNRLWPPNHRYVTVNATVAVSDTVDPDVDLTLVAVTSNEPDSGLGDGDLPNDIVIVDDDTFNMRAERSGSGSGRLYTITYRAQDACGNSTLATATVTVPHDQGRRQ